MSWLIAIAAIALCFFFLPPLFARLPRPKGGGMLGPALSQLNAIFNPAERSAIHARQELPADRQNDEPKD